MIKKSIKYIAIAGVNIVILTILFAFGQDAIQTHFDKFYGIIGLLKIISFSFLGLLGIRTAVGYFRKRKMSIKVRIKYACIIMVVISSVLYIDFFQRIYENRIMNRELRMSLIEKIEPARGLAYGTKAHGLTLQEYKEITKLNWFPEIENEAYDISYFYTYDGFLPDFSFELSYSLPVYIDVEMEKFKYGKTVIDTTKNVKRINYSEFVD